MYFVCTTGERIYSIVKSLYNELEETAKKFRYYGIFVTTLYVRHPSTEKSDNLFIFFFFFRYYGSFVRSFVIKKFVIKRFDCSDK